MALRKIKGQNFRAFVNGVAVRAATGCSVNINGNTEDATTKDSENSFTMEQVTSKSWSVNVDSVNAAISTLKNLLSRIKSGNPLQVGFDHTTGEMNRTAAGADFARTGMALLTDLSIQADNRATISISEQYTGTGPLSKGNVSLDSDLEEGYLDKGQHLRLFISKQSNNNGSPIMTPPQAISLATTLTFHISSQTEESTTKDSTDNEGTWQENEVTGLSYDFQIGAMTGIGTDNGNTLADVIDGINDTEVSWELAVVSGEQNRTIDEIVASGQGKLTNVNATGQNRQNASYTATLTGYGPYEVME